MQPYQSINHSDIHSTEARATVRLCRIKEKLNVLTDKAVRQFSGREFQSLGAATEKRRAAMSKLCGGTDRSFCVDDRSKRDYGLIKLAR